MNLSAEIVAWVAAGTAVGSLGKQIIDIVRKRAQEKTSIEEALDQQPLIRQQLELGNVGTALSHINQVVVAQAGQLDRAYARIAHLENREQALEAEVSGWEQRYQEQSSRVRRLETFLRGMGYDPATVGTEGQSPTNQGES